jgi:hypothetical protein
MAAKTELESGDAEVRRWSAGRHKRMREDITRLVVKPLAENRGARLQRLAEVRKQILK